MEDWYTPTRIWTAALLGLSYTIPAGVAFLKWDYLRHSDSQKQEARRLWGAIASILACLAIAMWLQAPHLLETWGRDSLIQAGVWSNRRSMQAIVIGMIALAGGGVCDMVLMRSRADLPARLLFVGALAVAAETLIGAVSFHYVDLILGYRIVSQIRLGALIRGAGIMWLWVWTAVASQDLISGKTPPRHNHRG